MHHGKEIYLFFGIYGINGIIGIIISQTLIGIITYKTLIIVSNYNVKNYNELINTINKNNKINEIIKIIVNIFLLISFYIMIAGFSAYFAQELGIPNIIGTVIVTILCYIILLGNIEGIIKVNVASIPILILFIILLSSKNLNAYQYINEKTISLNLVQSMLSAILYASYNSITLIPILISLKEYVKNKNQIKTVSLIVTIILIMLAIAIYGLILKVDIDINKLELPTVYVAGMYGKVFKIIYGAVILVAIFTSAIATGYSLLENVKSDNKKYKKNNVVIMRKCNTYFTIWIF